MILILVFVFAAHNEIQIVLIASQVLRPDLTQETYEPQCSPELHQRGGTKV